MTSVAVPVPAAEVAWSLPDRGRVGMYGLIAAEAAIFTIFVVAYLFYVGKSLSGPLPNQVLHAPIVLTICLLSSSLTIHLAVAALREVSMTAYKTAQDKKQDAMLDVADKLTMACSTCHDVYRDIIGPDGKPVGIEGRCTPKP